MKKITIEQINTILATVYGTNIPAQTFDQLRKLLSELPDVEDKKKETKEK